MRSFLREFSSSSQEKRVNVERAAKLPLLDGLVLKFRGLLRYLNGLILLSLVV